MLVFEQIEEVRWKGVAKFQLFVGRAKIPGGWLVGNGQTAVCFVPDPDHRWDGSSILDTNAAKDAK